VLDTLAPVAGHVFLHLALLIGGLVDGDDHLVVGALHDLGIEARAQRAPDVEFAGDPEAIDPFVEVHQGVHLARSHVVGEVVHPHQAGIAEGRGRLSGEAWPEGVKLPLPLHEVVPDLANALDGREAQSARPKLMHLGFEEDPRPLGAGLLQGDIQVLHGEIQGADAFAMGLEIASGGVGCIRLEDQDIHSLLAQVDHESPGVPAHGQAGEAEAAVEGLQSIDGTGQLEVVDAAESERIPGGRARDGGAEVEAGRRHGVPGVGRESVCGPMGVTGITEKIVTSV